MSQRPKKSGQREDRFCGRLLVMKGQRLSVPELRRIGTAQHPTRFESSTPPARVAVLLVIYW